MKSINQIRKERLRELVQQFDGGKTSALTLRMGWKSDSLATRYLTDSPRNNKPIGDALAREFEQRYNVPPNYLDNLPATAMSPTEQRLLEFFRAMDEGAQQRVLGMAAQLSIRADAPRFGPTPFEEDVRERHQVTAPQAQRGRKKQPAGR